jgi:tetratricopeptide (TPR) repeat protein
MDPQIINTGDPAQDREIAEQIKQGIEAGGMKAEIKDNPTGGVAIFTNMQEQAQVAASPGAQASGGTPVSLDPGMFELGGTEAYHIKQEMYQGNISKLREYLKKSLADKNWNERWFMLDVLISNVSPDVLDQFVEAEPDSADVYLMRGAYSSRKAWMERGSDTSDNVSDEQWAAAEKQVETAISDLEKAAELQPNDPTPKVYLLRTGLMFSKTHNLVDQSYSEAVKIAPDLVIAHASMISAKSKKWGGSMEQSLEIARKAVSSSKGANDLYALLFYAHSQHIAWLKLFEKNEAEATAYFAKPEVQKELAEAFDKWVTPSYKPSNHMIPYLHYAAYWFFKSGDKQRLKKSLELINNIICEDPWSLEETKTAAFGQAYQMAMA